MGDIAPKPASFRTNYVFAAGALRPNPGRSIVLLVFDEQPCSRNGLAAVWTSTE